MVKVKQMEMILTMQDNKWNHSIKHAFLSLAFVLSPQIDYVRTNYKELTMAFHW